jgi:hypothetical protein
MRSGRFIPLLLTLLVSSLPLYAQTATLRSAKLVGVDGETVVDLLVEGEFTHRTFTLEGPPRFVCDLEGVVLLSGQDSRNIPSLDLKRLRMAQFAPPPNAVTRVVFDLLGDVEAIVESRADGLRVRLRGLEASDLALEDVDPAPATRRLPVAEPLPLRERTQEVPAAQPMAPPPAAPVPAAPMPAAPGDSLAPDGRVESTPEAAPAGANSDDAILVTYSGDQVETDGPFRIEGRRVVFTNKSNQALTSLRLADVDLEATEQATTASRSRAQPSPIAAPPPTAPVLTITDADVRPPTPPPATEAGEQQGAGDDEEEGDGEEEAATSKQVTVASWKEIAGGAAGGFQFYGTLRNGGRRTARGIQLTVNVYDEDGNVIASAPATLARPQVAPGATVNFRASFPALERYETVGFDVHEGGGS